jgi:pimeloyl-ACP methyl ester carboxylesterase
MRWPPLTIISARCETNMNNSCPKYLDLGTAAATRRIAVRTQEGKGPGLLWLGGFKSDMHGTKAQALAAWAAQQGRACVRFDYAGHGESSGEFGECTISTWVEDSLAVFDAFCRGAQVLVGSSMGGWIALLMLRELKRRAAAGRSAAATPAGLVLIAPAVDFTEVLMWQKLPPEVKQTIERDGSWNRPSAYSAEPYPITRRLIEEGRKHLLLGGLIETGCPVRILQGVQDPDVPWTHAVELSSRLAQDDVVLTLVKDGDHRLSRPEDIERLLHVIEEFDHSVPPSSPAANNSRNPSR